ncbi:MAG: hypothetical protein WKG52_01860 [Variovorax sp.]
MSKRAQVLVAIAVMLGAAGTAHAQQLWRTVGDDKLAQMRGGFDLGAVGRMATRSTSDHCPR